MTNKTAKTKIAVSPNLEASRSPVDGVWRAYVPIRLFEQDADFETSQGWVCVATGRKAKDAIETASGLLAAA